MKISIITPSYNQAQYLERSIQSVWNQEGDFELEHILIDGGSKDESISILKRYDQYYRNDQFTYKCKTFKFIWLSEPDQGQSDALNKGFSMATGDIFGWLNSDDLFCSNHSLQVIHQTFLNNKTDIVAGNAAMIDDDDEDILNIPLLINRTDNKTFQKELAAIQKYNIIIQPSCLFKKCVWKTLRIENYYYVMDWVLWIQAFKADYQFFKIDYFIGCNRIQNRSKTVFASLDKTEAIKRTEEIISLYKKNHVWCLNRLYFSVFLILIKVSKFRPLGTLMDSAIMRGKSFRNSLIERYKLY